jgi:glycine C-acetyltransferase
MVMIDDCHGVGVLGQRGGGTPEHYDLTQRVDIVTGTLGKALGGASGGYTSGRKPIIDWLRQRSRPYLFSNTLCPMIAATSLKVLDMVAEQPERLEKLQSNTRYFRQSLQAMGFKLLGEGTPIIPILLEDAALAVAFASQMLQYNISALHSLEELQTALAAFEAVGKQLNVI